MSRIQRIVALAAVGLLGAIGVTGVMAGAGGVFGGSSDNSPAAAQSGDLQTPDSLVAESGDTPDGGIEIVGDVIACPSGEDEHFEFEIDLHEFEVKGTLVSLGDGSVVVTGPSGDVTASVDANTEIEDDPQPGDPVEVEGTVLGDGTFVAREIEPACEDAADDQDVDDDDADEDEDVGDVIACPSGEDEHFEFEIDLHEFEVKGTLVSLGDGSVVVTGPSGDVTASVDANTEIEDDPQPGDPVEVEGTVLDDGTLVAREVESACDDDDDDAADDGDDSDDGDVEDVDDGDVEDVDDGDVEDVDEGDVNEVDDGDVEDVDDGDVEDVDDGDVD